jgi:uncharacterized protein DUF6090
MFKLKIIKTLKGKWPEYLFEIIVLTVGIFGAFLLNNWNENQKKVEQEQITLKNLSAELKLNLIQLDEKISTCNESIRVDTVLLSNMNLEKSNIKIDELDYILEGVASPLTFDPADGVMNDILISGKINLIRNEELKFKISAWESNLNEVKEVEQFLIQLSFVDFRNYFLDRVSIRNAYAEYVGKSKFSGTSMEIFKDMKFENLIVSDLRLSNMLEKRFLKIKKEMNRMIHLIESEIED